MKKSAREKHLEAQVRHLADIAALSVGFLIQCEIDCDDMFEKELSELYRERQGLLLDTSAHFTALRERLRGTVHYERAQLRLREHMTDWLKQKRERKDAKD